jgi:hypothetical protein
MESSSVFIVASNMIDEIQKMDCQVSFLHK